MDVQDLIARFRGPLVGFLASLGNDARTARELAQDTIAQAYLSRDRFRGSWTAGSKVGPWLIGIARRLHLENLRSRRHRLWGPEETHPEPAQPSDPEVTETDQMVARAVQGLTQEWREVLTMRYSDDNTLSEIGECLGLTKRAVEGRLRRARQELEVRLRDLGIETAVIPSPPAGQTSGAVSSRTSGPRSSS